MHDILYHQHHLENYDHLEFLGVVPRTFIGALLVSILGFPTIIAMSLLQLPKIYSLFAVRLVLVATDSIKENMGLSQLKLKLNKGVNPDEAVAYGAAVQGSILSREGAEKQTFLAAFDDAIAGVPGPSTNTPSNPFGNSFYGAGSGLIRGGLGAYGEKILGSSFEYVQSNIRTYPRWTGCIWGENIRIEFRVCAEQYKGHRTRITEPVGGRLSYKPPMYDINAPDLYILFMAFGTYVVLAGFSLGLRGKFSPEALNWLFIKGLVGWFLQVMLLKVSLLSLGNGEAPLLDMVAYAGYTFTGMCLAVLGRIMWSYSYYFFDAMDLLMHGNFLGEDNEASSLCRGDAMNAEAQILGCTQRGICWMHACQDSEVYV